MALAWLPPSTPLKLPKMPPQVNTKSFNKNVWEPVLGRLSNSFSSTLSLSHGALLHFNVSISSHTAWFYSHLRICLTWVKGSSVCLGISSLHPSKSGKNTSLNILWWAVLIFPFLANNFTFHLVFSTCSQGKGSIST